jgi:hypothetical protein
MTRLLSMLGPTKGLDAGAGTSALTIRYGRPDDVDAIEALAELDSQRAPRGTVLVAELDDELLAAVALDDLHAVADPFRPTSELVFLLIQRARQLRRAEHGGRRRRLRVRPAALA